MNNSLVKGSLSIILSLSVLIIILLSSTGCDKESDTGFNADFNFTKIDDNNVLYENTSSGEYYSMIWDFGNGQSDTTTDKKNIYTIYYHEANEYEVSLQVTNFTGENQTVKKSVNIDISDLVLSFTANIIADDPNYVQLINTTQGEYESFSWKYNNVVVDDEMEHIAYFPFMGNYKIELLVTKNNITYSTEHDVFIAQDDPGNLPGLIWSDEFNYFGLPDPNFWNMETGGNGWGNNELQYYTNRQENALVDNGILTITAKDESYSGRDYTSARITTQNKFDFKYGRIEASIKLPYGQGIWPAFWMLGANFSTVGWPSCGEIDIMEMVGGAGSKNKTTYSTIHWDNDGQHASYGESYSLSSGILADDFHVFAVEWNSQQIKGFIDDIEYFVADITPSQLSEFHDNFFILLNVAVGGDWPGSPDATTTFPQTMEVDYVRVYDLGSN